MGPVWKRGSCLLVWEGGLGEAQGGWSQEGSTPEMQEVQALMDGILKEGWNFLEGAWGPFRLLWVDLRTNVWIMARAPQGLKPLFWSLSQEGMFFAQDIPSLLDLLPRLPEPDWKRVPEYMVFQNVAAGNTLYQGVRELLPGEVVLGSLSTGETALRTLWPGWLKSLFERTPSENPGARQALWEAIQKGLSREPVAPKGLFLSGGVDSALLAWGLKELELSKPPHCFTVTCPGYVHDEAPFAHRVARELELPWEPIPLEPSVFSKSWEEAVSAAGLPLSSTNQVVWWILCKAASEYGLKRVFSGEGADGWISGGLYQEEKEALLLAGEDPEKTHQVVINSRTHLLNDPLLVQKVLQEPLDLEPRRGLWKKCLQDHPQAHPLEKAGFYHVRTVGHRLLTRADLAATAHGLGLELPFLEQGFLSWLGSLDWEARNPPGQNKAPLKSLCAMRFGAHLAYRRKIGFPFPIRTWIRDSQDARLRDYRNILLEAPAMGRPVYSRANLEKEIRARLDGKARPADWLLWSLVNLELWLRWLEKRRRGPGVQGPSPTISPTSPGVL